MYQEKLRSTHTSISTNTWFTLSDLALLRIDGAQAASFLQGQLSCDVREVNPEQIRPGALCNLKGRIIALLDVIDWRGLALVLPQSLKTYVENDLAAVARLSHVTLKAEDNIHFVGLYCPEPHTFRGTLPKVLHHTSHVNQTFCYALAPDLYLFLSKEPMDVPVIQDNLTWHQLLLERHLMRIYPKTSGHFLPQPLGLHHTKCFSFHKGCYKGQEIIARMHYRGSHKYSLQKAILSSDRPLFPGMHILSLNQEPLGELIDFAPTGDGNYLILASILQTRTQDFLEGNCTFE